MELMQIYRKNDLILEVIEFSPEMRERGDFLIIEDVRGDLLVQVIDMEYLELPGLLEETITDLPYIEIAENGEESILLKIRDATVLKCKIRGILTDKGILTSTWIPSRVHSSISHITDGEVLRYVIGDRIKRPITIGKTRFEEEVVIDAKSLDGKLTVITGKKGTGKSHLSKIILKGLLSYGAPCLVFDINGEYVGEDTVSLTPGDTLKFTLRYVGSDSFLKILDEIYGLPSSSLWEVRRVWESLGEKITLEKLKHSIRAKSMNEHVRDAILRRLEMIEASRIFTDEPSEGIRIEEKIHSDRGVIVNLKGLPGVFRRMIVDLILTKIIYLLEKERIPPIFLFAEEAHTYHDEKFWEDLVTRMRHIGISLIFITNQPDRLSETIYRQADNVFLFNFTNENDLSFVSKASRVDSETVRSLVSTLPPRYCLILGEVVGDIPIVLSVVGDTYFKSGRTKCYFD